AGAPTRSEGAPATRPTPSTASRPPAAAPATRGASPQLTARFVGHHRLGPRRIEHDVDVDALDPGEPRPDRRLDEILQVVAKRTRRARHRHRDADRAVTDVDAVDEPEIDDVDPELGIDDVLQRVSDVGFTARHHCSSSIAFGKSTLFSRW